MAEKQCNLLKNGGGMKTPDYSQTVRTVSSVTGTTAITYTAPVDSLICVYQYGQTANYGSGQVNGKECAQYAIGSNSNACPLYFIVKKNDVVTVTRSVSGNNSYMVFQTPL